MKRKSDVEGRKKKGKRRNGGNTNQKVGTQELWIQWIQLLILILLAEIGRVASIKRMEVGQYMGLHKAMCKI